MKLTIMLLTVVLTGTCATGVSQNISFSGRNVPLGSALSSVEMQTDFVFLYSASMLASSKPVSIKAHHLDLKEFLAVLFRDQPLEYLIEGKSILISPKSVAEPSVQQPVNNATDSSSLFQGAFQTITGTVYGSDGIPLAGATVRVKGSVISVVTNEMGQFSMEARNNDLLIISYVGFSRKEVKVTAGVPMRIQLVRAESRMDTAEVVLNTGYQTLARERSTGSFSSPDMQAVRSRSVSMDLLQRLDGLVPGLTLNNAPIANIPGAGPAGTGNKPLFPVLLRGLTSVNSNTQPLYVVDGIPVDDFSTINPNDVQSVTVLKDATAASIWGARAANGVIVVTTRKGVAGQKLQVNYDQFFSLQGKPDIGVFPTMNSEEYISTMKELFNMPGYTTFNSYGSAMVPSSQESYYSAVYPHEFLLYHQVDGSPLTYMPEYYKDKSLDILAAYNNLSPMKDLFYRNALLSNQTVSVSGSAGKYNVYASLSYTNQKDPYPGNSNNTYKLNARQDITINKALKVYLITDFTNNKRTTAHGIYPDSRFLPYAPFRDEAGSPLDMSWLLANDSMRFVAERRSQGLADLGQLHLGYTPLTGANNSTQKNDNFNTRITTGFTWQLPAGLRLEGIYGAVLGNNQSEAYDDISNYRMQEQLGSFTIPAGAKLPYPGGGVTSKVTSFLPTTGGKFNAVNVQQKSWTIRNQLIYDKNWNGGLHQLTVLAGTESRQQIYNYISSTAYGYDRNLLTSKPVDVNTLSGTGLPGTLLGSISGSQHLNASDFMSTGNTDTRFSSYYGNIAYTFRRTYTLNASSRYDRSNMFGTDRSAQSRPVWSVGGSWLLTGEHFMDDNNLWNQLLVRATYGITGNAPVPPGAANKDILSPGTAPGTLPGGAISPLTISSPANRSLTWEQTKNLNFGIDFSMLNHRLSGTVEYYHKHTTNLISLIPLNTFSGFSTIKGNAGTINNGGIEIKLSSVNINTKDFTWTSQLNFAHNKGKIVSLNTNLIPIMSDYQVLNDFRRWTNDDGSYQSLSGIGLVSGYQPFTLFAYHYAGLDSKGDPQISLADGSKTSYSTAAQVSDLKNMGTYIPVYSGSLINMFTYRHFTLSVNMIYNLGHVMRRDVNDYYSGALSTNSEGLPRLNVDGGLYNGLSAFNRGNIYREFADRWKKPGDEAFTDIPAFSVDPIRFNSSNMNYYTLGDINVLDASYIKARDITLVYGIPATLYRKAGVQNIELRVQLNNLMIWKANHYGIDPEFQDAIGGAAISYTSSGYSPNVGSRTVPFNQHSWTIGVHLSF